MKSSKIIFLQFSVLIIGIFMFLNTIVSAKYKNILEYFNYVDSRNLPRILILGGERITSLRNCSPSDVKFLNGKENYFFANILPETDPDFICNVKIESDMKQLGIGLWDIVIGECLPVPVECFLKYSLMLLKVGGFFSSTTISYITFCELPHYGGKCVCKDGSFQEELIRPLKAELNRFCPKLKEDFYCACENLDLVAINSRVPSDCLEITHTFINYPSLLWPQSLPYAKNGLKDVLFIKKLKNFEFDEN